MGSSGPGKVFAVAGWEELGDTMWAKPILLLYNFDINGSELKKEHVDFLHRWVAVYVSLNPGAKVELTGTASQTGESEYDRDLSGKRARAVMNYLISHGVDAAKFDPPTPNAWGKDHSHSTLKEDEGDRAVIIKLKFPLTIEKVSLHADDWGYLGWDDIVGLDTRDGKSINLVNIQVTASGAPKLWVTDGGRVSVMPDHFDVKVRSRLPNLVPGASTILAPKVLSVPIKDPDVSSDEARTNYRKSFVISEVGNFLAVEPRRFTEVATIAGNGATSDAAFRTALGWSSRGVAELSTYGGSSGSERDESPDAARLLQAGGVEVLAVEGVDKGDRKNALSRSVESVTKALILNPAHVFYYAGDGKADGCLANGKVCWASPDDLKSYWKQPFDLKVLILAGCPALSKEVTRGMGLAFWAKLLRSKGGPLIAILGYGDDAPADKHVGEEIAKQMGEKIAAGLANHEWVDAWLEINGDHPGKNTWNAVGMDSGGYGWIGDPPFLQSPRAPWKGRDKYAIKREPIG